MRIYIVIVTFAVIFVYTTEAAGRKKIVSTTKLFETKNPQNATETVKNVDKTSYPKKAVSLKKRPTKSPQFILTNSTSNLIDTKKSPNEVTEIFKNLPEDDLEFIKELDKQFKLHGGKLKIKVVRDNGTNSSKNSKRTIEGDLGYGYEHNGYNYERPKFMFYPYSQKDIPSDASAYPYPQYKTTSVTIEPSYSYELKPQTYLVAHAESSPQIDLPQSNQAEQYQHQTEQTHQQHHDYQEPIIVLRIPGPTKYATHLQALLQQYLEIRAAQYLRILEETEARKQQTQSQHFEEEYISQQQQQKELNYEQQQTAEHVEPPSPDYSTDADYSHQVAPAPHSIMYPTIDDVYQSYKDRQNYQAQQNFEQQHQQHQQNINAQLYEEQQSHIGQPDAMPQYYYPSEQQIHHQQQQQHVHPGYQHVYLVAMNPASYANIDQHYAHQQHPIYVQEEETHQSTQHLPTNENSPRSTHTKILFTQDAESSANDHSNMYPLPSIKPFDRHAPTSTPHYHQQYQEQYQEQQQYQQHDLDFQQTAPVKSSSRQEMVAITQHPYNYHAHSSKMRSRNGRKRATSNVVSSTTTGTPNTVKSKSLDENGRHLNNMRKYVHEKLGAKTGLPFEIKTT